MTRAEKVFALAVFSVILSLVAVALSFRAAAGPGRNVQLDHLCTHPAFAAVHPLGDEWHVGLKVKQTYCGSNDFKHPRDYGSAPEPSESEPEPAS